MGIYTNKRSINESYIEDIDFDTINESAHPADMVGAYRIVAENEYNYNQIMQAVAINELNHLDATGREFIYEAADISGFFGRIKQFFMSILAKVAELFKKFFRKMDGVFMKDKEFVKKYKKELATKAGKLKDFEYKGFEFIVKPLDKSIVDMSSIVILPLGNMSSNLVSNLSDVVDKDADAIYTKIGGGNVGKYMTRYNDDFSDIEEEIRGKIINRATGKSEGKLDSSEFTEELFRLHRSGEDAAETIDSVKIYDMLAAIENSSTIKREAEKSFKAQNDSIKKTIKDLDNIEKTLIKSVPKGSEGYKAGEGGNATVGNSGKVVGTILSVATAINAQYRSAQNFLTQYQGSVMTAYKDENKQARRVCVAALNYKSKNEGYSYDEEYSYNESATDFSNIKFR